MEKDLGSKIDSHSSHDYHRREDKGNLELECLLSFYVTTRYFIIVICIYWRENIVKILWLNIWREQ